MAILTDSTPIPVKAGKHAFSVDITSGTVDLQWNPDGTGFKTITDGTFSADGDGIVELSQNCTFQAVISATAVVTLNRLNYG